MADIKTVEHVDTTHFADAIKSIETMANALGDLVSTLDDYKADLIENWVGKGRNQFEVTYEVMKRKLSDGKEITWDMYEDLISSEETFIQNDVDVANGIASYS